MKALTVWQPWASLIAIGAKPYEFRGWKPPQSVIGQRIAIHAAARPVKRSEVRALIWALNGRPIPLGGGEVSYTTPCLDRDIALPVLLKVLKSFENGSAALLGTEAVTILPLSHIVCTAVVGEPKRGDACAAEFGENAGNDSEREGTFNWGWPMLDVHPVMPPMPVRGAQGLWNVSDPHFAGGLT